MIQDQWQQYLNDAAPASAAAPGLAWLPEMAAVRVAGSHARDFLQGYLTSDVARLQAGVLAPTALCNLKGRVVVNGWCTADGNEDVLLVLHASLADTLAEFLKPYLMFSRHTSLIDLRGRTLVIGSLDLEGAEGLAVDSRRRLFAVDSLKEARVLWERHRHITADAWLAALTADGIPLVSRPVSGEFLPQMLGLDVLNAVDFHKGCYLGQEVVARAQHRGQVKRRLARLIWEGATPPSPGAEVTDTSGKPQGVVVQSARDTANRGPALAVLSTAAPEALRQGETLLSGRR